MTAPSAKEIKEFEFKLLCQLKIYPENDELSLASPVKLVTCASKYGLIFTGNKLGFQCMLLNSIVNLPNVIKKKFVISDYPKRSVNLGVQPCNLVVSADNELLAVCLTDKDIPILQIYSVTSFGTNIISKKHEIRLSSSPGTIIIDIQWNPAITNIIGIVLSDGSAVTIELKDSSFELYSVPGNSQSTCLSWSPKGKQVVLGSKHGYLIQYKPELKAVRSIPPSNPQLQSKSVISIQWLSSYQFLTVFHEINNPTDRPAVVIINVPKLADSKGIPPSYINYDELCYASESIRPEYYFIHQQNWNIILVGSCNSMEVTVLGQEGDSWVQWLQDEAGRAELPLTSDHKDVLNVGMALDLSAQNKIQINESVVLEPMPLLYVMSNRGILCIYHTINRLNGVASLCFSPQNLPDLSGISNFIVDTSISTEPNLQKSEPVLSSLTISQPELPKLFQSPPNQSLFSSIPLSQCNFPNFQQSASIPSTRSLFTSVTKELPTNFNSSNFSFISTTPSSVASTLPTFAAPSTVITTTQKPTFGSNSVQISKPVFNTLKNDLIDELKVVKTSEMSINNIVSFSTSTPKSKSGNPVKQSYNFSNETKIDIPVSGPIEGVPDEVNSVANIINDKAMVVQAASSDAANFIYSATPLHVLSTIHEKANSVSDISDSTSFKEKLEKTDHDCAKKDSDSYVNEPIDIESVEPEYPNEVYIYIINSKLEDLAKELKKNQKLLKSVDFNVVNDDVISDFQVEVDNLMESINTDLINQNYYLEDKEKTEDDYKNFVTQQEKFDDLDIRVHEILKWKLFLNNKQDQLEGLSSTTNVSLNFDPIYAFKLNCIEQGLLEVQNKFTRIFQNNLILAENLKKYSKTNREENEVASLENIYQTIKTQLRIAHKERIKIKIIKNFFKKMLTNHRVKSLIDNKLSKSPKSQNISDKDDVTDIAKKLLSIKLGVSELIPECYDQTVKRILKNQEANPEQLAFKEEILSNWHTKHKVIKTKAKKLPVNVLEQTNLLKAALSLSEINQTTSTIPKTTVDVNILSDNSTSSNKTTIFGNSTLPKSDTFKFSFDSSKTNIFQQSATPVFAITKSNANNNIHVNSVANNINIKPVTTSDASIATTTKIVPPAASNVDNSVKFGSVSGLLLPFNVPADENKTEEKFSSSLNISDSFNIMPLSTIQAKGDKIIPIEKAFVPTEDLNKNIFTSVSFPVATTTANATINTSTTTFSPFSISNLMSSVSTVPATSAPAFSFSVAQTKPEILSIPTPPILSTFQISAKNPTTTSSRTFVFGSNVDQISLVTTADANTTVTSTPSIDVASTSTTDENIIITTTTTSVAATTTTSTAAAITVLTTLSNSESPAIVKPTPEKAFSSLSLGSVTSESTTEEKSLIFTTAATDASVSTTTSSTPLFGSGSIFNSTSSSIFGNKETTTTPFFSGTPTTSNTIFGFNKTNSTPNFGQTTFGTTTTTSFGTTSPSFGVVTSSFGAATTSFGATTSSFGTTSSSFGTPTSSFSAAPNFSNTTTATSSSTAFGSFNSANKPLFSATTTTVNSVFGSSVTPSVFGSPTTTSSTSVFGATNNSGPFFKSVFGSSGGSVFVSPTTTQSQSVFGNSPTFSKPSFGSNVFGQNTSPNTFGSSGGSLFGSQTSFSSVQQNPFQQTSTNVFGSAATGGSFSTPGQTNQSGFGAPASFSKPAFGAASTFGSPPAFGTTATFGNAPAFGSPSKSFGSPTSTNQPGTFGQSSPQPSVFENLANQNTMTFGNLAQQGSTFGTRFNSPPQQQTQQQQSPPFGGSSFSSWR